MGGNGTCIWRKILNQNYFRFILMVFDKICMAIMYSRTVHKYGPNPDKFGVKIP